MQVGKSCGQRCGWQRTEQLSQLHHHGIQRCAASNGDVRGRQEVLPRLYSEGIGQ
jgi:hypothetical protein